MHRDVAPAAYIAVNRKNGTSYTGVTSNLMWRIFQHRTGVVEGFAKRYDVHRLVWFNRPSDAKSRSRNGIGLGKLG